MKIKKISARNLKSGSFTQELDPVTVLVGQNRSGKSSRTDAIRLALAGYLPELGKHPSSTFSLASGGDMSVEAELEGGQKLIRSWRLNPKGKVEYDDGGIESVPSVQLDPSEFFSLTPGKRSDYVSGLLTVDGSGTVDAIASKIVAMPKQDGWLPDQVKSCDEALAEIADYVRDAQSSGEDNSVPFFSTLKSVEDALKERCSLVNANLKAAVAARDQMSNSDCDQKQGRECAAELATWRTLSNEMTVTCERLRAHANQIERDLQSLEKSRSSSRIDTSETEVEIARLTAEIDVIDTNGAREAEAIKSERASIHDRTVELGARKSSLQERLRSIRALNQSLVNESVCPTCGACKDHWGDASKLARTPEIDEITAALSGIDAEFVPLNRLETELIERSKRLSDSLARRKSIQNNMRDLTSGLKAWAAANAEHDRMVGASEETKSRMQAILDRYGVTTGSEALDEIKRLITENTTSLTGLDQTIAALETQQADFVRWTERQREIALASLRVETFRIHLDAWKHGLAVVRDERARLVEGALKGLADSVNLLVDDVLPYRIAFENGEFGYRNPDGRWVPWSTWSGSEQQIGFVSVSLALASKTPHRIAIVDELGRLDVDMLWRLLKRVVSLVASGSLHQFIGIDVEARVTSMSGVTVSRVLPSE